ESGNYTDDSGSVEIEITKVTLSIDADDKSKDFNSSDPPFTYALSGFVNGEDEQSAGVTGEANCTREAGESVAGSPYEITCTAGTLDADNYGFETGGSGELTITEADALVRYIGETVFVSSGSSSTTAKVTLTASLQAATGLTLGTATVNFIDVTTGKVLAANVPVQPVAGQTNVGTANTNITLSTGQFGAESYLIRVVATGNYTNDDQDDADKTATVVAMKPTTINSTIGGGSINPLVPRGTYAGDLDEDATFSIGMQYTSKGTNLKGKITLYVPQADGSIILVKSNSISSMKVTGTTTKTSTVYTKASISRLDGGVVTAIEGNVTLRVDVLEPSTGPANSEVGFTVLSTSNSRLFYSNRWVLENNVWKTKTQTLEAGAIDIN
ncbi:MAG: MBG domain-containing protein, partial [Actinomycetota bacterium]